MTPERQGVHWGLLHPDWGINRVGRRGRREEGREERREGKGERREGRKEGEERGGRERGEI